MSEGQEMQPSGAETAPEAASPDAPPPAPKRRGSRTGLRWRLAFLAVFLALILAGYGLIGRAIPLPVFVVAEIEARLNRGLATSLPDVSLALGGVDLALDEDLVPRLRVEDLRVLKPGGAALLTLPELRLTLQGRALLSGEVRLKTLRVTGARLVATRDAEGRFDFSLGDGDFSPEIKHFSDLFDMADRVLASPDLSHLTTIEAEALTLSLTDKRLGRTYELGDGRLRVENRADAFAAELTVSLQGGGDAGPGRALVQLVSQKAASQARITAEFSDLAAADVAGQAPLLAPLALIEAPISGRMSAELGADGVSALEGSLSIGKGVLRPTPAAVPVAFDRGAFSMSYDAASGAVRLSQMEVQSPSLRAHASGQAYLIDEKGARISGPLLTSRLPSAFVTQIAFDDVRVDPEGVFAEPVHFGRGALDFRLRLDPFSLELGQLSLAEDVRRLVLTGQIGADARGWSAALDLRLNEIDTDRLIALWPQKLVEKTRAWVAKNVLKGNLRDVVAALRLEPGAEPRLHLAYQFDGANVQVLPSLPPIENGRGYATIEGRTYTMVMTEGQVTAPKGGPIDMAGSVFAVPDVTEKPARANIRLTTRSSLTAALSLLDLPPFNFLSKAERPVDLGEGLAEIDTRLSLPLEKNVPLESVDYHVTGRVTQFSSDKLVAGRKITAEALDVAVDPKGLVISGPGHIGTVAFDARFTQGFAPADKGHAKLVGRVALSQAATEEFGLGLPAGMVSGQGQATVEIDLAKGKPGELRLGSDLSGIGLALPELGWAKPAASKGKLLAEVTLGAPVKVHRLVLDAAGLRAEGAVSMRAGGGLDLARFDKVTLNGWLDGVVELQGRGPGRAVGIALKGGTVDLRAMPPAKDRGSLKSTSQTSGPLRLELDRLLVSKDITLHGFRGDFSLTGGFSGDFMANLNEGGPRLRGTAVPSRHGTAVRILSDDAGAALASAAVFSSARGGDLTLTLTPREAEGQYDGVLAIQNLRVRNANVLAELLNAVSVVGLLEQLNGQGLVFNDVEGEFLLTPELVDLRHGSATGASLGVSMAGLYQSGSGQLAMQGVISPVYLLNGVGAVLTKRGEGVFGFNYTLGGTADNPDVGVNPLSILTPGMFRGIFRALNTPKTPNNGDDAPQDTPPGRD